ncbi:hypothetical protein QJS04_geneDACA010263 [Acorus gramineus]|uniref:Photosystem II 5 kDa protein, chloroplastic n=1 Tax=Acorus gramineus TaxID=55184 RepID=A0AAV9A5I1_ACOGR|nr:hypothetical protein QJS04_geneDACA010263 [Acorus gramineus]
MASLSMTTSLFGGAATSGRPSVVPRRGVVVARASRAEEAKASDSQKASNTRRDLVFSVAAAAAAVAAAGAVALAGEGDPKPGSPEAKKKYAPICVTMPTAKICRN